ncbi:hypothetical protein CHS0354_002081 [Potamilus streckersoni]|uniref:Xylose isomerase-like TIM barrel domain-containing protein n=1 Tax=Potamilus streckersoni TaxID=2493646 RepID=A0AAE0W6U0_9BIVA|nr:hypothetical protein CHS0354_002081 [Potamilus streckersoni]
MKIGLVSEIFGGMTYRDMLKKLQGIGIEELEFCCAAWSKRTACGTGQISEKPEGSAGIQSRCNPMAPGDTGKKHHEGTIKTFQLAKILGIKKIVMMSGLPAGGPDDKFPNWVTTAWPPECGQMLEYQWKTAAKYWKDLVKIASENGIEQIALELHGFQLVYSCETFLKLRKSAGSMIGINFDPSHFFWMGADPLPAVSELKEHIFHVHAKDTRINHAKAALKTLLETESPSKPNARAWNYTTLGYGHDEYWWRRFILELRSAGYDGVLSIEHEDALMTPWEGVIKSVEFLKRSILTETL